MADRKSKQKPVREGPISRAITAFFDRRENRVKIPVSKRTYILLAIFLGIIGAHRFYAHHWIVGALYLATCWCGVSVAMTVIDILAVVPMQADENGKILL